MNRTAPFAVGSLVGTVVFVWLAGPILEARFGAESLLVAYGGISVSAATITYVLARRVGSWIHGRTVLVDSETVSETARAGAPESEERLATLDELDDPEVEREVTRLKSELSAIDENE
ncbi:hypothetical protein [Halobaculum gomorrense]|uniref:Uncharacterized protein n=1 Tax=Halobaculum gomorrense TaxID=43928 RepID=A0A1M5UF41_9EURY|nr:hypothetical protein [Halobaculum gomorrense]SHH61456.1 hypothetical protein SAMN05443636_3006 [Halobaculum gomorrense]